MSGAAPGDATAGRPPGRRRRHRRVDAPPTNPEADTAEAAGAAMGETAGRAGRRAGVTQEDAWDVWIRAQRPPHWD